MRAIQMRKGRRRYGAVCVASLIALSWSHSALSTGGHRGDGDDQTQEQGQDQGQDQSQEQGQDQGQDQSQSSEQANAQSVNITSRVPGRSYVGGGSSNAADTRVRAISGGWLTGSAGIRWDVTDREARTLRIADDMESRGQVSASDRMRCSLKNVYKNVGGTRDRCYTELSGSRVVRQTSYNREYDRAIRELQQRLEVLQEDVERDEEACQRRWESCVRK